MDNQYLGELVLKQVDSCPESFAMGTWGYTGGSCGTIACLAGHAMLLSGYRLVRMPRRSIYQMGNSQVYVRPDGSQVFNYGGEAQVLLGMADSERYRDVGPWTSHDIFLDMSAGLERFQKLVDDGKMTC